MEYNFTIREKDKGIQLIISYKDNTGRWRQKSKQGFKTQREAKLWGNEQIKALEKTLDLNPEYEGITFEKFKKDYLKRVKRYREPNTFVNYESALKHFSNLNKLKMVDIKKIDIQECVDNMTDANLESSTIKEYLSKLKALFNSALDDYEIIPASPVRKITIPEKKENRERYALSYTQFVKLIDMITKLRHKAVIVVAGACGLRASEMLGLTWDCVDFKNAEIKINKQWKEDKEGTLGFGELKSKRSYRSVPMSKDVIKILKKYKKEYPTDINNRVFLYSTRKTFSRSMTVVFRRNGYEQTTLHELRHTYATTLIANGVDFKTVAKLMGHDVEQTIKTYSHVTDDMLENGIRIVNNAFIF